MKKGRVESRCSVQKNRRRTPFWRFSSCLFQRQRQNEVLHKAFLTTFFSKKVGYSWGSSCSLRVTAMLKSSSCLSSLPAKFYFAGTPRDFKCSGEVNGPGHLLLPHFGAIHLVRPAQISAFGFDFTRQRARPTCRGAPLWMTRGKNQASGSSCSLRVTAIDRSSNCLSSTKSGQAIIKSEAFCTLGKAMTSRMELAPAMSMHRRSRP